MATERQAQPMSDFFKFTEIGDMAAGRIKQFKQSANGPFAIMVPGFVRKGRKGKVEKYATVAVPLSTDARTKIDMDKDKGLILSFIFDDKEPTTKGSDKKIFKVMELNGNEAGQLNEAADKSKAKEVYKAEEAPAAQGNLAGDGDDEDDLPF